jgi:DNA polymerase-3 subunit beta
MIQILVPPKAILALRLFSGKKDVRYYINGICFEIAGRHVTMIATNGKMLGVYRVENAVQEETIPKGERLQIIVPIALFDKVKANDKLFTLITFDLDSEYCEAPRYKVAVGIPGDVVQHGISVIGNYPYWQNQIPAAVTPDVPLRLDTDSLERAAKAVKLLGTRALTRIEIQNTGRVIAVQCDDKNFLCLISSLNENVKDTPLETLLQTARRW